MWEWLDETIAGFRSSFGNKLAYEWFCVIILGFMIRVDHLGVTSIIRELNLNPQSYETLIHFFHANSWAIEEIMQRWAIIIKCSGCMYLEDEMPVLVGDGVKVSKEAKKMPGVKKQHQESENSAKPTYMFGHLFGSIGILIGSASKMFCVPVSTKIQDGVAPIRKWENNTYQETSHVVEMIRSGCQVATYIGKPVILLLDRYFLSVPALKEWRSNIENHGKKIILVTKAKASAIAYQKPEPRTNKRGRPPVKGEKIKLQTLFQTRSAEFSEVKVWLYNKEETVKYLSINLLWGSKLYQELQFVLVKYGDVESILVSTDLLLAPVKIIRLYSYRFKIEVSFGVFQTQRTKQKNEHSTP